MRESKTGKGMSIQAKGMRVLAAIVLLSMLFALGAGNAFAAGTCANGTPATGDYLWIIILVVVLAALAALIVALVARRKGKDRTQDAVDAASRGKHSK